MVVVCPGQLADDEVGARAAGRVLRVATEEDILAFGRLDAEALEVVPHANALLAELRSDARATDAWLSPDGARLWIAVDRPLHDARLRARQLAGHFGRGVELRFGGRPLTGVQAAGLAPEDSRWLALPDSDATVRLALRPDGDPRAGAFIERAFPAEERPRRRQNASPPSPSPAEGAGDS
jgi:hypothetical protein